MIWYGTVKTAGHGDTMEGQHMRSTYSALRDEIEQLRESAIHGGPDKVSPRWRGELRRRILLLPPVGKLGRMSMYELGQLKLSVDSIKDDIKRRSVRRFEEILGADSP